MLIPSVLLLLATRGPGADAEVPAPTQAYSPGLTSIFYFDLAGASQSDIWKGLASQLGQVEEQVSALEAVGSLPGGAQPMLRALEQLRNPDLQALKDLKLAEIVLVSQGNYEKVDLSRVSPDDTFLVSARLTTRLEDQDALVNQLAKLLNEEKSGLGDSLTASRSREGAADLFEIPAAIFGDQALPFPLGFAVGPGAQGSVIAVGRMDAVKSYLNGATSGELPAKVQSLMPNRGQLWVYGAIPPNLSEAINASGAPTAGAPGMAQAMQVLNQLREFGLNISFNPKSMEIQVLLGCTGSDVAATMVQQVEALKAFTKKSSIQTPGFLNRLRASSSGDVFKLTTLVDAADLKLAGVAAGHGSVVAEPLPEMRPPVQVDFLTLLPSDDSHIRRGKVRIKNLDDRAISEIRLTFQYRDARGAKIGSWTRQQRDPLSDVMVRPNATREMELPLFNLPLRTEQVTADVEEVVFKTGDKWVMPSTPQ